MEIEGYKCCDIVNLWSMVLQKSGMKSSLVFKEDFLEEVVLVLSQMGVGGTCKYKDMEGRETL